jgi:SAM-dependent methyltransferase
VQHVDFEAFESSQRYALVAAFHVLEHVSSPKAFLAKCNSILEDNGLLYLEVPNFNRPGGPYRAFLQFPHLYSFTYVTLANYLVDADFHPIFVDEAVANLTVISRRGGSMLKNGEFTRIDISKYLSALKWKNRIYGFAKVIPRFSVFGKVRSLINSAY